eukprot:COSAG02_NODE_1770_length_10993_cov_48.074995_9_plen_38_part_00
MATSVPFQMTVEVYVLVGLCILCTCGSVEIEVIHVIR